jgi:hypothetical protein
MTAQPIAPRLIGGIPWRGGPQISDYAEATYATEQADYDDYDFGEDL